jgi:lipoate-protein ligase A
MIDSQIPSPVPSPLKILNATFSDPARNLACDEALLDELDEGTGHPTLRFWMSATPFVVLGYGNQLASEVNVAECHRRNIPILRRCSGGGTVLQGYGCLNYSLTLPIADETATITSANTNVMTRHRDVFSKLLNRDIDVQGHTDLTIGSLKFSGNAQRRKKNALLFHGCFLLDFDLDLISALLTHPTKEPTYRAHRPHADFLTNLHLPESTVKSALVEAWNATEKAALPSHIRIEPLVAQKYNNPAWNEKF